MLAAVDVGGAPLIIPPEGWQQIRTDVGGQTMTQALYYRIVGPAEPSNYAWVFSSSTNGGGAIVAYRGVDQSNPIVASSGQVTSIQSTSIVAPVSGAPAPEGLVVGIFGIATNTRIYPPTYMSDRANEEATAGKDKISFAYADTPVSALRSWADLIASVRNAGDNIGQLVLLRPTPTS
jgi:hypothetical protein